MARAFVRIERRAVTALNRTGFCGPANVLRVAGYLANGPTRAAAVKILSIAVAIYPEDAALAKALAELQRPG